MLDRRVKTDATPHECRGYPELCDGIYRWRTSPYRVEIEDDFTKGWRCPGLIALAEDEI